MLVDGKLRATSLPDMRDSAITHERQGYRGLWTSESAHDPFLPLTIAAEHTARIELGTSIAVAFARTPMTLAYPAWDLQQYSDGRLVLGLGSQVKPHIERRFAMPWSRPAARMREMVTAIRAIWTCWQEQTTLDFQGEFYRHTVMTPFFSPPPSPHGLPRVVIAAVGEAMSEVAGEVCDGIFLHGFTTDRYLREVTLPAIARGRARSGRCADSFQVYGLPLVATGEDAAALETAIVAVRNQIAFYGSTPAYRGVLALHGWGALADELHALSRTADPDRWTRMGELVDDDVLEAFAVVGEPDRVAGALAARYGDVLDRLQFYAPYDHDPALWEPVVAELSRIP